MASVPHPQSLPPMPAVARILSRFDRPALASFICVAIDLLDVLDGDSDREEDDSDTSVEDDPQGFDAEEDRCLAGDDMVQAGPVIRSYYQHYLHHADRQEIGADDDAEPKYLPPIMDEFAQGAS